MPKRHAWKPGDQVSPDTQFKPGQSGNPAGRTPGSISYTAALKLCLEEDPGQAQRIMRAILEIAENQRGPRAKRPPYRVVDQIHAAEMVWDRLDGKPKQTIDLNNATRLVVLPPTEEDPTKLPERDPELLRRLAGMPSGNGSGNGAGAHE